MKKILFSLLALSLVLTGCKEEKNPPLSVSDINTYVILKGQVSYESNVVLIPNQTYPEVNDGYRAADTLPVQAGLRVEARVDYGMYKDGVALNRFITFSALTNAQGEFAIKVPVPATIPNFAIADLTMQSFYLDNYPIPNWTTVPVMIGMYEIQYPSYEILYKRVYFDGNLPTIFAALPVNIVASQDTTYSREYFLGTELIYNPGMVPTIIGTPFIVVP